MGQRAGELISVRAGSPGEVFRAFLRLGCTSFGGPVAHLGYFRAELIERRGWIDTAAYADLLALCQLLPGPASSQVGFALGLIRAGWGGGLAAWAGFTIPSALLLAAFAQGASMLPPSGVPHGLALVAVAVVAQAVGTMARALCPDRTRASLAAAACVLVLLAPSGWGQIAAIALAAVAGRMLCRQPGGGQSDALPPVVPRRIAVACLAAFATLLAASLAWPGGLAAAFYRSGALVFGGGHVVLPLLHEAVVTPGWVSEPAFVAGYGVTQAAPGPLFTFAAYLGMTIAGWRGGVTALLAISLPGLLLLAGALPYWTRLRRHPDALGALRGVNAAVVGLLAASLYDPIWTGAVHTPADFALALCGFVLLSAWHAPPMAVVALGALAGLVLPLR